MAAPSPIDPDELLVLDRQLCFALYTASRLMTRAYRPLLAELGLTYPQYLVMLALWEVRARRAPAPTLKDLGDRLHLDSGTLTPLLRRLEQIGYLERRRGEADERTLHLHLTRRGAALKARAAEVPLQLLCDREVSVAAVEQLRAQLGELIAALDEGDA